MNDGRPSPNTDPRDALARRALFVGWWCVMTVLPIGHLTGLRNVITPVVVLGTVLWAGRDSWRDLPARWWALALLAWCGASIAWSVVPATSFGKWRVDLLLPLFAYAAAFGYVRRGGRLEAIIGGTITGIALLALLSVPALLPDGLAQRMATLVRTESFATIANPMPVWFPGVGDASMAAALATVGVLLARRIVTLPVPRAMFATVVFGSSIVLILVAINNRNATLTIPVVALLAVWLDRRRAAGPVAARRTVRLAFGLLVVVLMVGALALLETGARQRLRQMGTPVAADQSGLVVLTEHDTRPMIWSYYTNLARRHPLAGVGFGRTVPGITWHTEEDKQLARIEGNAYSHAHNLLLNWWLQTGVVGVALLIGTLGAVVARAWRGRAASRRGQHAAATTVAALVAAMLLRNMTDDFLIFGMASMFWILVGAFSAASMSARAIESPQREP